MVDRAYHRRRLRSRVIGVPYLQTDTTFMANRSDGCADDAMRRRVYAKARRAGINPHGKVYSPQMGEFFEGKGDIRRHCERTGAGCEDLGIPVRPPEEDPWEKPYRVADDVVANEVEKIVGDEVIGAKEHKDLTESTRTRLTGANG